jgi:hypothetical protein
MYPAQYNSWFPSDDNDDTAYIPDFKNRTMRFGSINQSLHHSDIISTSSGHSQTPCIDFQVPVHSDSLSLSYSHSVLSFSSLNSPSVTDSQTSNSSSSSVPPIIGIEALFKLNTPESLYQLFTANQIPVSDRFGDRWRLLCPECESWCQTSVHIDLPLCTSGQFKSLVYNFSVFVVDNVLVLWEELPSLFTATK